MRLVGAYLGIGALEGLQYPIEAAIWFLFDLLPPIVMVFLWLGAYEGRAEVAGYTLDQMLGYYVGILILQTLITAHAEWDVSYKIRKGEQNPTTAYMTGKLKIKGDMGAAMKLQKLF